MSQTPDADDRRTRLATVYRSYEGGYAARWSLENPGNRAILEERRRRAEELLESSGLSWQLSGRVLDLGAGSNASFPELDPSPGRTVAVDLLLDRLAKRRSIEPDAKLVCADGSRLPFADETFDLVLLSTVLSSVPSSTVRRAIVAEAYRVARPGGGILCYDFKVRNPSNHHTVPIRHRELRSLLPGCTRFETTLTVAPPLARRLGRLTGPVYPLLARVPALRTHRLTLWRRS